MSVIEAVQSTSRGLTALLLGSAAIGALVSSLITLYGQRVERKARRAELLVSESVKLAMAHRESLLRIVDMSREAKFIPEQAKLVEAYFIALSELVGVGRLPKGMFTTDSKEDREAFGDRYRGI